MQTIWKKLLPQKNDEFLLQSVVLNAGFPPDVPFHVAFGVAASSLLVLFRIQYVPNPRRLDVAADDEGAVFAGMAEVAVMVCVVVVIAEWVLPGKQQKLLLQGHASEPLFPYL